jgi:transcriptional regulator GlxA family with amidase domain
MTVVAILVLDGVVGFEATIPGQVFGTANLVTDSPAYEIRIVSAADEVTTSPEFGSLQLRTPWDLDSLAAADTILIPARAGFRIPPPDPVLVALRAAAARGARIASMCVGAFTLAATGLLDGLTATTHWEHAAELARQYPRIDVRPSVLFVDHGALLTSAGVAAGLDLCIHLVRRDLGAAVAADTARRVVMPPQRDGGQAQFIVHTDPADQRHAPLQDTLAWLEANLHRPLTLAGIAAHAGTSVRSLNRHFRSQVGTTPLQWLLKLRVNRAQHLLETTDMAIAQVAREAGLGAAPTLRHHFGRIAGVSPQAYRAAFHSPDASSSGRA